jgi:hypothetical protein
VLRFLRWSWQWKTSVFENDEVFCLPIVPENGIVKSCWHKKGLPVDTSLPWISFRIKEMELGLKNLGHSSLP